MSPVIQTQASLAGSAAKTSDGKIAMPVSVQALYENENGALRILQKSFTVELDGVSVDAPNRLEDTGVQVISAVGTSDGLSVRLRFDGTLVGETLQTFSDLSEL